MPNSFQQPINNRTRGHKGGDDYGSYMGFPVMRMMRDGRPAGYQVQFNGEWMDLGQFQDPRFQSMFVEPFRAQEREQSYADVRKPGMPATFGGYPPSRRRGGGMVGSRSMGGGQISPEIMQMLLGG